ncbi:MAG: hypothetical protein GY940_37750, partial [bacterium]|nr:hypothetical protein [bacterium]
MVLSAVINLLLARLSGGEDIVVGTPSAGRRHADLENIIGMFINTLPLRNYPRQERGFKDFLKEVGERTLSAFENQDYPFEDLVEHLVVERDTGRNPLFDVMFVLENIERVAEDNPGLKMKYCPYNSRISKFDLTLTAAESGDNLASEFEYCSKLFKEESIHRYIGYFKRIVS